MRRVLAIVICVAVPGSVCAQDDFSHLKVKLGQIVYVTDTTTGVEVSGPLKALSPTHLSIDGYAFEPREDLKVERLGDPVWDGAAWGFGIGFLFGAVLVVPECSAPQRAWQCVLGPAAELAAIGAFIDWRIKGRTTIYDRSSEAPGRSVRFVPDVGAHRRGAALVVRF